MSNVEYFLDGLESGGFWDEQCSCCGQTFADTEPDENPEELCSVCREDDYAG